MILKELICDKMQRHNVKEEIKQRDTTVSVVSVMECL